MHYDSYAREMNLHKLAKVCTMFNAVEIATPSNYAQLLADATQRRSFYNPVFQYDEEKLQQLLRKYDFARTSYDDLRPHLAPETPADVYVLSLLEDRFVELDFIARFIQSILSHDDASAIIALDGIYGSPTSYTLHIAKSLAIGESPSAFFNLPLKSRFTSAERELIKGHTYNAFEVAFIFQEMLHFLHVEGWKIIVTPQVSSVYVRDSGSSQSTIFIPASYTTNGLHLLQLIVHELGCHLFSSVRTRQQISHVLLDQYSPLQPLTPFLAKSANETFYEGVAKLSDIDIRGKHGMPNPETILYIDKIRRHNYDFQTVHQMLYEEKATRHHSTSDAFLASWKATYRLFRGATTPAAQSGYVFPKDAAYFCGFTSAAFALDTEPHKVRTCFFPYSTLTFTELQRAPKSFYAFTLPTYRDLGLVKHAYSLLAPCDS